ncbi:MAG: pyrroline-5-carboxylate reductase [Planctomycetota bacterium]
MPHTVAILGCGNMGGAIATSLATSRAWHVVTYDPDPAKAAAIDGAEQAVDASSAVDSADAVIVAVKPQVIESVLRPLAETAADKLVVSVAAGTPSAAVESWLTRSRVVRTMPNTPLLVGRGVVAIAPGLSATEADVETTRSLFPNALVEVLSEAQMDAATALSGSGPAYFMAFTEALATAGQAIGLPADAADGMARETFIGAARWLESTDASPADLRRRVTSPGGTTQAALESLSSNKLEEIVRRAVDAASRRGAELSSAS